MHVYLSDWNIYTSQLTLTKLGHLKVVQCDSYHLVVSVNHLGCDSPGMHLKNVGLNNDDGTDAAAQILFREVTIRKSCAGESWKNGKL